LLFATLGAAGCLLATVAAKICARALSACIWSFPMWAKGAAGAGCCSACVRALAASCAASAEDVCGIVQWCGKKSKVGAMRSAAVFEM
jgi:hypothetical protein